MMSLIPFFIIAGFLESFVTRHYQTIPEIVKWMIILMSFGFIILYYVIYPIIVARKHPDKIALKEVPRFIPKRKIEMFKIRKVGEVFTDTFYLFIKHSGEISRIFFTVIFPLALALIAVIFAFEYSRFDYNLGWVETFSTLFGTANYFEWYKLFGWSFLLALLICDIFYVIQTDEDEPLYKGYFKFLQAHLVWMSMFALLVFSLLTFAPTALLFLSIFIAPFLGMIPATIVYEKTNFFNALARSFSLGKGAYGDSLGSLAIFAGIFFIFMMVLNNPLEGVFSEFDIISMIDNIIKDLTITVFDRYAVIISCVNCIIYVLFIFLMFSIYSLSFAFSYHSSTEMKTAKGLYDRLDDFGKRNKRFESDLDYE